MGSEDNSQNDKSEGRKPCSCPFCDAPVQDVYPFCKDCGRELDYCSKCGKPVPLGRQLCAECEK